MESLIFIDYEIYKRVTNKIENDRGQSYNLSLKKRAYERVLSNFNIFCNGLTQPSYQQNTSLYLEIV